MHHVNVVLHSHKNQGIHDLLCISQGNVRHRRRLHRLFVKVYVHSQGPHVRLEIVESGVDKPVAVQLGLVHIVKLRQNDLEGLVQAGNIGDLPAVLPPALLHPEVRVDQNKGLYRQIFRLQIPGGMIGRNVACVFHAVSVEPLIRIIIMKIRHSLIGLTPELAQVVACCSSAGQSQVNGHACLIKAPGHRHGHIVNPRDVLQSPERSHFRVQTHHLINVFFIKSIFKFLVFCVGFVGKSLFL